MPADPEMKEGAHWLSLLIGGGAASVLSKLLFNSSRDSYRMDEHDKKIAQHDARLDKMDGQMGVLVERSEVAVEDRKEMIEMLRRIEDRLP